MRIARPDSNFHFPHSSEMVSNNKQVANTSVLLNVIARLPSMSLVYPWHDVRALPNVLSCDLNSLVMLFL